MFLKDKYESGILEVRATIRIVPGALGDFRKTNIKGTMFLQAILMSNFMFLKDKYENGILEVWVTIRIVPGTLGDVPQSGHLRNYIPTGNIGGKLYVF